MSDEYSDDIDEIAEPLHEYFEEDYGAGWGDETGSNILTSEVLKTRPVKVLTCYNILQNDDDELLFVIKRLDSPEKWNRSPRLYYDGGPHAILLKNDELVVVCDHIHPEIRKLVGDSENILFAEHSSDMPEGIQETPEEYEKYIQEEYEAEVLIQPGIEAIAEELMRLGEKEKPEKRSVSDEFNKIKKILVKQFGKDENEITFYTDLVLDLEIDELDRIELTMAVEAEFEVIIPDEVVDKWETVGEIAVYIANCR